jgi:uncharacterized iron-regulated membrane protein
VRRWARALVPVALLLLLTVPFLVFWWAGWIRIGVNHGARLEQGVLHDTTSIYMWTALAVVYLVWAVVLLVGTVWAFDRLGYHYQPYDRPARPTRRERRRKRAGMSYLRAQQQQAQFEELRRAARESRRATHEADDDTSGGAHGKPGGAADHDHDHDTKE